MNDSILAALQAHGSLYADEIAQIVGLDKGVVVDALRRLSDNFDIYPEQLGMQSENSRWFLVEFQK